MFRVTRKIIYFYLIIPVRYLTTERNEQLISLGLTNDRSDRDNIGFVFVINERGEKMGLLLRNESKYGRRCVTIVDAGPNGKLTFCGV